jgi:hypothetical protein
MKQWLRNKLLNFLREEVESKRASAGIVIDDSSSSINMDNSLRFNVLTCNGGTVLELRTVDRRTHDSKYTTYIIPDGEDIATRIGHIVSMEILKS